MSVKASDNSKITRIAMWSGPRNISTAMMRAWENRADTVVVDEPFYACYLTRTGIVHPMQSEVLASQSSDWGTVVREELTGELPDHVSIQYQKHMTQHMVDDIEETWFAGLTHAFLIRHPAAVAASYGQKRGSLTADDIGFKRQKELYDLACSLSDSPPPVIDAKTVLTDPKQALSQLCTALSLPFDTDMLSWPAGRRDSDGAWAPHWYQNVERSTGFAPYHDKTITLDADQRKVVDECLPYYETMAENCIAL